MLFSEFKQVLPPLEIVQNEVQNCIKSSTKHRLSQWKKHGSL